MITPISVVKPPGKNFMIVFESNDKTETIIANFSIRKVMDEANLHPFHQIGTNINSADDPGYHGWEAWANVSQDDLESLIPKIILECQTLAERW